MSNDLERIFTSKSPLPVSGIEEHGHALPGPHYRLVGIPRSAVPLEASEPILQQDFLPQVQIIRAVGLYKSYRKGSAAVPVLSNLHLEIRRGEFLAIVGQSGSGKSTLLHLLGALDSPDQGEIHFDGRRIDTFSAAQCDALRNKRLGMIFQFYHLLPEFSTLENVLAPLMIVDGVFSYMLNLKKHKAAALELLETLGLSHRLKHKPRELSGGEMQRTAIARALVAQPEVLLADEPTGNLDQASGQEIMKILRTLNQQRKLTIVMVTHDQALAQQADHMVRLTGGRIEV